MVFLEIAAIVLSLLAILLVLLHKPSGAGLSDMFGGQSTSAQGSAQAPKNLSRMLWGVAFLWFVTIFLLAVL